MFIYCTHSHFTHLFLPRLFIYMNWIQENRYTWSYTEIVNIVLNAFLPSFASCYSKNSINLPFWWKICLFSSFFSKILHRLPSNGLLDFSFYIWSWKATLYEMVLNEIILNAMAFMKWTGHHLIKWSNQT